MEVISTLGNDLSSFTTFRRVAAFLLVLVALSRGPAAIAQAPTFMRYPNTFGDKIVFEAHDNLWLASLQGGTATQITHGLSHDLLPRFSPDGKWIAFTRINQRSEDEYAHHPARVRQPAPASSEPSPFTLAARTEDADRLARSLESLEPVHREVLVLRFQEDLSLQEISAIV
jgi:hypothetical protein